MQPLRERVYFSQFVPGGHLRLFISSSTSVSKWLFSIMVKVVKYNAIVTILHPQKFFFSYFPSFA